MHVETTRVKSVVNSDNPLGFIVINKSDFVEGEHEHFDDEVAEVQQTEPAQSVVTEPAPAEAAAPWLRK
jgi:hypothetical protein